MIEKQTSHINNQIVAFQTYHKSTYTGLPLNFKTSFSNKFSLIKCLIDRLFKICNSFHNDIENIKSNLTKNAYPLSLIDKSLKSTSILGFLVTKIN